MSNADSESPDVNSRDLKVLVSIASTGSFRNTAAQLFTTQPAITRAVARLEGTLGVRLFERGPRGAQLTGEGKAMIDSAKRVLGLVAEMHKDAVSPESRLVIFGAAATAAGSFLAPFLAEWIPSHPGVRLRMLEDGAARLQHRLERKECDIAIIASPSPHLFSSAPITRVGIRAYFPLGHPLGSSDGPVPLSDLRAFPLLVNEPSFLSTKLLIEAFDGSGIQPQIVYRSSIGRTLAVLAEAGLGVAVFGDSADVRGTELLSRPVTVDGHVQLGFDLEVAWLRSGTPQWIRDFGEDLSAFSYSRVKPSSTMPPGPTVALQGEG